MKTFTSFLAVAIVAISFMSFSLFRSSKSELPKAFADKFSFVPGKLLELQGSMINTGPFYMAQCEVTNADYRKFLLECGLAGEALQSVQVDSTKWRMASYFNEPFVTYYFAHPAYDNYPVVNVSYEGALAYCKWLSSKINAQLTDQQYHVECVLPSRAEWLSAANSDLDDAMYSWDGPTLQNAKGQPLCNYSARGDQSIHFDEATRSYQVMPVNNFGVAGYLSDNADITAPVYAYAPNKYGLFNLNGNVAEMVAEKGIAVGGSWRSTGYDVRNQSVMSYDSPNPAVGFRPMVTVKKV